MILIRARDHRELQAVILAMKRLGRDLKKDINAATREEMNPVWRSEIEKRSSGVGMAMLSKGAGIGAGNPPKAKAATSTRGLGQSKRLKPSEHWAGYEFGADREAYSRYTRKSKNGGTHTVERRTMRHLPRRKKTGHTVFPALQATAPRMVSLWVQIVIRKTHEAFESR